MIVVQSIPELQITLQQTKLTHAEANLLIGFVPTMGYLHAGHESLIQIAKKQCHIIVLSIFINPLQFGQHEDYDRYPQNKKRDIEIAKQNEVDIVFMPALHTIYPTLPKTTIHVHELSHILCGETRPTHFAGVATIVTTLFHLVQPNKAFFGMKDAQQFAIIQQMVKDLHFPIQIVPCPIVREADGLAMSSRNVYLTAEQRIQAVVLAQSLHQIQTWLKDTPDLTVIQLQYKLRTMIQTQSLAVIEYIQILTFPELTALSATTELATCQRLILIALAVQFGKTRLIDNCILPSCTGCIDSDNQYTGIIGV